MMLATKSSLKTNFLNFQFNCKLPANSKYFGIVAYYKEQLPQNREQIRKMIFESACDFWQSLAILFVKGEQGQALHESIITLHKIEVKINEIIEEFELNLNSENELPFKIIAPPIDFSFECRIKNQERIQLGSYLKSKKDFNLNEKILWSSDAYFSILAYQELAILTDEQLKNKALDCIKALNQHYKLLQKIFSICDSNGRDTKILDKSENNSQNQKLAQLVLDEEIVQNVVNQLVF